jgi:tRNA threonylcarbamoyladenosine dehydratase
MQIFSGIEKLYGPEASRTLQGARVVVIGLGGVGSWCVEALARSGVGNLRLIDMDEIAHSNTNRQLPALSGNYGRLKVEALAERCLAINPAINVEAKPVFLNPKNTPSLLQGPIDFVIDAIDQVSAKAEIFNHCQTQRYPLAISGASGGKTDPSRIKITDLGLEQGDPLLKSLKRRLIKDYNVTPQAGARHKPHYGYLSVWSDEISIKPWEACPSFQKTDFNAMGGIDCGHGFGSACFVTGAMGFALASIAVNAITSSRP